MIIPDSIEPYEGWKALDIVGNRLVSPQRFSEWPPKERFEAYCSQTLNYVWEQEADRDQIARIEQPVLVLEKIATATSYRATFRPEGFPQGHPSRHATRFQMLMAGDRLEIHLPDGTVCLGPPSYIEAIAENHHWALYARPHTIEQCSCGIYSVSSPHLCRHYVNYSNNTSVVAHVSTWGEVVRGSHGARGQYAYPQKLYCLQRDERETARIAEIYAIPYEVVTLTGFCTPLTYALGVASQPPPREGIYSRRECKLQTAIWAAITMLCAGNTILAYNAAGLWTLLNLIPPFFFGLVMLLYWANVKREE